MDSHSKRAWIWGVLMRRDSPLAQKSAIEATDLVDKPLITSRLIGEKHPLNAWFQRDVRSFSPLPARWADMIRADVTSDARPLSCYNFGQSRTL